MTSWAHGGQLALFTLAAQSAAASLASMRGVCIDNKRAPTQQAMNMTVHEFARLGRESHLRGRLKQSKRALSLFDHGYVVSELRGVGRSVALGRGR